MKHWMKLGLAAASALVTAGCQREEDRSASQRPGYEGQEQPAQQPGTGGGGDEGAAGKMELRPPEGEVLPETGDEPRPDERPMLRNGTGGAGAAGMGPDAGTGGAGEEGTGGALIGDEEVEEERTEGGTGTEVLQPGETDAKTGQVGTGGAGPDGTDADAGTSGLEGTGY